LVDATIFARWGEVDRLRATYPDAQIREVIVFKRPTNLSLFWGFIDWLSAVPHIDLGCSAVQHMFDFHNNRGVPELLITVTGGKVTSEVKASIKAALQANVGAGNTHKSSLINIPNSNVVVEVHKLAMDSAGDAQFHQAMMESVSSAIVSAHRIPPALGGLLIPGKMGAANESSNALMVFQGLVIGPAQELFETLLEASIGKELSLSNMDLKTIIDEISEQMKKLKPVDTMGRMKDSLPAAAASGRDPANGLKS
jgi:capsid portal protein